MFALSSTSSASLPLGTFPSRGRLEERTNQRLPLEGKLSAARLTDEVSKTMLRWYAFWNEEKYRRKKEDGTLQGELRKEVALRLQLPAQ